MAVTNQINWNNWIYRLIAYIIDSIIIGIVASIISFAAAFGVFALGWGSLIILGIMGVLYFLYYSILDVVWGATLGKRIMGLTVQGTDGQRLTFGKAFIRNLSKLFWLILFLDWLIGIISTGNKQQKFLDRVAGAVVVQRGQPFAAATQQDYPPPPPPPA
ncbi:RDD family protein [Candidatus Bathyarchaeota archaeon]|mgnify:CR=1 FL=1|nr:RDD family protein [Candidatus Bathyarchaeota archaeon]